MPVRPSRLPQLQSFAEWSDMVRSAMVWLDVEDPVKTQETLRENDPVLTALVRVATAWRTAFGNETRTVSEAIADAEQRTPPDPTTTRNGFSPTRSSTKL